MRLVRSILPYVLLLALIAGCNVDNKPQRKPTADPGRAEVPKKSPPPQPKPAQPAAASPDQAAKPARPERKLPDPLRGEVKETIESGGYTYVLLANEQGDVWVAARKFNAAVGDEVEVAGLMPMSNFHSPTMDRTFEQILFVSSATVIGGGGEAPGQVQPQQGQPPQGMPPGHPDISQVAAPPKPGPSQPPKPGEIEKLPDGLTVAELFEKKADLGGKVVRFRGRVVKSSRGILDRNWLHIQDGTGEPGSNDITVTSAAGFAPPGSVVVIEGTLGLDKDFGAGYAYKVIVEDATVTADE